MLNTEKRNPLTYDIHKKSTFEIIKLINEQNNDVISAIDKALPEIEKACDVTAETVKQGGRIFYVGAGTSGRLGVCDAAECPPTFGVSPEQFVGMIAGGISSMGKASESAEDDAELSVKELEGYGFGERDLVIGISASGSAEYVIAAVKYAKEKGARTVSITNNPDTALGNAADISICADTGPEVITGSTRMKAGTSQKIILNMISTTAMIKCGYVYENMMINLRPTNKKLRKRMIGIVVEIIGCDEEKAERLLEENEWSIRRVVDNK